MPNPRNHMGSAVIDGKIFAVGGQYLENQSGAPQSETDMYDPARDVWTRLADLLSPRGHITGGTFAFQNHICILGGETFGEVELAELICLDPLANRWLELPALPTRIKSSIAREINNKVYFSTGHGDNGIAGATFEGTPFGLQRLLGP